METEATKNREERLLQKKTLKSTSLISQYAIKRENIRMPKQIFNCGVASEAMMITSRLTTPVIHPGENNFNIQIQIYSPIR